MKIKVFALAVAAMALTVACNNNKTAEVEDTMVEDTMIIEEMVEEEIADSTTVAVAEEVATPAAKPAAKPVAKKEEAKVVNNEDGTKTVEDKKVGRGTPATTVINNEDGTKTVQDKKVGRR